MIPHLREPSDPTPARPPAPAYLPELTHERSRNRRSRFRARGAPFDPAEFPFAFLEAFGNKETTLKKLRSAASNKSDLGGVLQRNNIHIKVSAPGDVAEPPPCGTAPPPNSATRSSSSWPPTARVRGRGPGDRRNRRLRLCRLPRPLRLLPAAGRHHHRQADPRERLRHQGHRPPQPALRRAAEGQPRLGHRRAPPRPQPLHGPADLLLLRRGHRHLQRRGPVHRHRRADERRATRRTPTRCSANLPGDEHQHRRARRRRPAHWADAFPYVNGGLFSGSTDVPRFSKIARSYLLHVGSLDWTQDQPRHLRLDDPGRRRRRGARRAGHALHQRAEHPQGAQPAVPRRPARAAGRGGRQRPQAAEPAQAHGPHPGVRPGLRLGQLPRHRLQGDAGDRGGDQPPPRRGRPRRPRSR